MKPLIYLASLLLALSPLAAEISTFQHDVGSQVRQAEFSLKKGLMLEGYDVVSYWQSAGPQKGSPRYQLEYQGVRYHFINKANKAAFLTDPARYEPLYGGWCAYAMLDGDKTKVDPETFKIVDDHLLVFYNGLWGDTLKMWNNKLSDTVSDRSLLQTADRAWLSILQAAAP